MKNFVSLGMDTSKKLGDCFEANGRAFYFHIQNSEFSKIEFKDILKEQTLNLMSTIKEWRLIHSQVLYEEDKHPFSHCWIEGDDKYVFDFTTDPPYSKVLHLKTKYYWRFFIPPLENPKEWRDIENKYQRFEYTFKDVEGKVEELKSNMYWGPWDFESER